MPLQLLSPHAGVANYTPDRRRRRHSTYARLYGLYRQMHDAFGTTQWSGRVSHVMKELIAIREEQRLG